MATIRKTTLAAYAQVNVSPALARRWYLELGAHPERYRFDTRQGFVFTSGAFGDAGSRFRTRELFYGLPIVLRFELIEVNDASFTFRLRGPLLSLWGAFQIGESITSRATLVLLVGATHRWATWLLNLPFARGAVHGQIEREIDHIKRSMEATFGTEGRRQNMSCGAGGAAK